MTVSNVHSNNPETPLVLSGSALAYNIPGLGEIPAGMAVDKLGKLLDAPVLDRPAVEILRGHAELALKHRRIGDAIAIKHLLRGDFVKEDVDHSPEAALMRAVISRRSHMADSLPRANLRSRYYARKVDATIRTWFYSTFV